MGLFCVNFHFRSANEGALRAALDRRGIQRHRVLSPKGGWLSFYEEQASSQDDARIRELAAALSSDLGVPGVAFLVHDSDIACYWLFDDGRLVDEYNSCPDYFEDHAGDDGPSGGQVDLVLPYCRPGVKRADLQAILATSVTFAEGIVEQLAASLGIDGERALTDYRHLAEGEGPDGWDGFHDGDGGDDDDGGGSDDGRDGDDGSPRHILRFQDGLAKQLASLFGPRAVATTSDPRSQALVQAAVRDDLDEIDRWIAEGTPLDVPAEAPLPTAQALTGVGQLIAQGMPQFEMTPLLAAVVHRRCRAAERLLAAGADPNQAHPMFGSAVHAATAAGAADLLKLLLDHGGNVTSRNLQGQTPLQILEACRVNLDRLASVQAMAKSIGIRLPSIVENLPSAKPPFDGWNACEAILKSAT